MCTHTELVITATTKLYSEMRISIAHVVCIYIIATMFVKTWTSPISSNNASNCVESDSIVNRPFEHHNYCKEWAIKRTSTTHKHPPGLSGFSIQNTITFQTRIAFLQWFCSFRYFYSVKYIENFNCLTTPDLIAVKNAAVVVTLFNYSFQLVSLIIPNEHTQMNK